MLKVYSYPGKTSASIIISVGKATVSVNFSKGYMDKKMSRPAIFATEDAVLQSMIENSDLFGSRIFLSSSVGDEEDVVIVADEPSKVEYPDVTTYEEAAAVLKTIPGVKAAQLRTLTSAKKVAAMNGIVFPNYDFEN